LVEGIFCAIGKAEDEINDSAAKLAKIRPMRAEMYRMNWNEVHNIITIFGKGKSNQ